jgi:hypothetical protein
MRKVLIALAITASLASQPGLLDSFWTLLSAAWSGTPAPQPTTDAGCGWDPDGKPRCSA